jgi:hypothetical protein
MAGTERKMYNKLEGIQTWRGCFEQTQARYLIIFAKPPNYLFNKSCYAKYLCSFSIRQSATHCLYIYGNSFITTLGVKHRRHIPFLTTKFLCSRLHYRHNQNASSAGTTRDTFHVWRAELKCVYGTSCITVHAFTICEATQTCSNKIDTQERTRTSKYWYDFIDQSIPQRFHRGPVSSQNPCVLHVPKDLVNVFSSSGQMSHSSTCGVDRYLGSGMGNSGTKDVKVTMRGVLVVNASRLLRIWYVFCMLW